jgi:Na+-transporting methylmalonyl-CoA/oxaloacetate decarboxylase gamma subunit
VIESGQTILQMAGTTAAVGMGVVFAALFFLSMYMHYFKLFIGHLEGRHHASREAKKSATPAAPKLAPAPAGASAADADPGAELAAAVAVGLRLHGVGGVPGTDVVAAIAAALTLHRAKLRSALQPRPAAGQWQMSGRMEMMGARVRRQER